MDNKITLWTIQPIEWYETLLKNKIIYTDNTLLTNNILDDTFYYSYQWMQKQMIAKIGHSPKENLYPIWAWYQYSNSIKKRPDLRTTGFLEKNTKGVRIEFVKPKNEVVLSDFDLWHHPLNYWYIADNEKEHKAYYKLLKSKNINHLKPETFPMNIRKMIEQSWENFFDMNYCPEYSAFPFTKKSIQATFWSLSINEIKKVDEFIAK